MPNRRAVLGQGLLMAGAASLMPGPSAAQPAPVGKAAKPLRILILGGTGFIGPHHVRYAVQRGHQVSVFNRGRRQADLPEGVEHLTGDRNGDLKSIMGRDWDSVIDLPTTLPNWARQSAAALAKRAGHYTFISSLAVYTGEGGDVLDEGSSPLAEYKGAADPYTLTQFNLDLYGPLKVLSEREIERHFPGRTLIVRPALIVGPGDPTDRFTYWPVRMKQGGEILAPGDPMDRTQYIDVRDLAEFVIHMVERGESGAYNGSGPAMPLTFAEMLGGVRAISPTPMKLTWVPTDWLVSHKVTIRDLPVWSPPPMDIGMRAGVDRAVAKGMTFRPLATTAAETLASYEQRAAAGQPALKAGWNTESEREMLAAWRSRAGA